MGYFHKTQCFCFDLQMIAPHQTAHFPVVFYIDPEFDQETQLDDLTTMTLSYTFYRAESPELDRALEVFIISKNRAKQSIEQPFVAAYTTRGKNPCPIILNLHTTGKRHPYHLVRPSIWPGRGFCGGFLRWGCCCLRHDVSIGCSSPDGLLLVVFAILG